MIRTAVRALTCLLALAGTVASAAPALAAGAPIAVERDGDLFTFRPGGGVHRLTRTPRPEHLPAWSPDRRLLAFVAFERRLAWVDVAAGTRHGVVRMPARFERIDAVAFSPDGRRLAFSTTKELGHGPRLCGQVWTVGVDGSGLVKVQGAQAWVTGLAWGPGGRWLLASSEWPNGIRPCTPDTPTGILRFRTDGTRRAVVNDILASQLDLAPGGRTVVFRGWTRTCHACGEIWRMRIDGTHAHVIALPPDGVFGLYQPRFAPAGERIALVAMKRHGSLWLVHPDGGGLHRVLDRADAIDW